MMINYDDKNECTKAEYDKYVRNLSWDAKERLYGRRIKDGNDIYEARWFPYGDNIKWVKIN